MEVCHTKIRCQAFTPTHLLQRDVLKACIYTDLHKQLL